MVDESTNKHRGLEGYWLGDTRLTPTKVLAPAQARHGVRMDITEIHCLLIKPRHERPEGTGYSLTISGTAEKPVIVMRNSNSLAQPQRCGAHARSTGKPCVARALANGRCRNHGGMSAGPKTTEGKARALANLKQFRDRNSS